MPRFKIWQKLTLVVLVFSLLLGALLYSVISEKQRTVASVAQARAGAAYLIPVRRVLQLLPQYEQEMNEKGDPSAAVQKIEEALRNLEFAEQKYGPELQTKDQLAALNSKWQALKGQGPNSAPLERQTLLGNALTAVRNLITQAGNTSELILAYDVSAYYTMDLVLLSLPEQQDSLARLWQLSFNVATRHDLTPETRARMLALTGKLRGELAASENSLRVALGHEQTVTLQTLNLSSRECASRTTSFLNVVENWLAQPDGAPVNPAELNQSGQQAFAASLRLWDAAHPALDNLLQARAAKANQDFMFWLLLGGGGWLLWLLCGWLLVRRVTQPLRHAAQLATLLAQGQLIEAKTGKTKGEAALLVQALQTINGRMGQVSQMAEDLAGGNLSATVTPLSAEDKLGHALLKMSSYLNEQARSIEQLANGHLATLPPPKSDRDRFGKALTQLLEQTHNLRQGQKEHERTQQSILNLLQEVSEAATGDLTVEAEVKGDPTGAIADAFNLMIGKLRQIIYKVKDTTFLVNQSAVNIQLATDELAAGSEHQAGQLKGVVLGIRDMSNLTQVVAEHASNSAAVARRSFDSSKQGAQAVQFNLSTSRRIREQMQETTKRIQRLGERSQEIAASLQLIKDIASRTSMLALNASIQAGIAGPAAHGFVVVAEEIEVLSERTTNVAKQITTLTRAIQTDTQDVAAALEATSREALSGSSRASEAAAALADIEEVSDQMMRLIQAIWQAAQKQTHGVDEMAKSLREISRVTHRVQTGSQETAVSVRQLVSLAEALGDSVVTFRLPEKTTPAMGVAGLRLTMQTELKEIVGSGGVTH